LNQTEGRPEVPRSARLRAATLGPCDRPSPLTRRGAPFVDDPDYSELIDELLADACRHYPLTWHRDGDYRQIAIDGAAPD
jgi:hypothetical protein